MCETAYFNQYMQNFWGLYYKHMTIVNEDSIVIIKWSSKLIDAARGVIYDRHIFIVQATVEHDDILQNDNQLNNTQKNGVIRQLLYHSFHAVLVLVILLNVIPFSEVYSITF